MTPLHSGHNTADRSSPPVRGLHTQPLVTIGQIVITLVNNISFSGYNGDERNSNTFFFIPWTRHRQ